MMLLHSFCAFFQLLIFLIAIGVFWSKEVSLSSLTLERVMI